MKVPSITSGHIVAVLAGILVLLGLALTLPQRMQRSDSYAVASVGIRHIEHAQLGDYFACVLVDSRTSMLDGTHVRAGFDHMGVLLGASYAPVMRSCEPAMDALVSAVQALQVPEKLSAHHAALRASADALRAASGDYQSHLSKLHGTYDSALAAPTLDALGQALSAYQLAEGDLQLALGQPPEPPG